MSLRGEILVAGDSRVNAGGAYDGPANAGLLVGEFCARIDQVGRCMPRPTKRIFSTEPPHVEPAMATGTGRGQNSGCPEMRAWLPPRNTAL